MNLLRFCYQTIEIGDADIHVRTLRDKQQFADNEGIAEELGISSANWPLFGIIWPSGEVLAHLMQSYDVSGKKILEVGCGIALASLVLNHREADITATDYHPEAGRFLSENTRINEDRDIPFLRTAWEDENSCLGEFDLIIGSDLLYEQGHVRILSEFINNHTKEHCEIILVDPGRGNHAKFSKRMIACGYDHSQYKPENTGYLDQPFKGQVLHYNK